VPSSLIAWVILKVDMLFTCLLVVCLDDSFIITQINNHVNTVRRILCKLLNIKELWVNHVPCISTASKLVLLKQGDDWVSHFFKVCNAARQCSNRSGEELHGITLGNRAASHQVGEKFLGLSHLGFHCIYLWIVVLLFRVSCFLLALQFLRKLLLSQMFLC